MRKFGFENECGTSLEHGLRFLDFPEFDYGEEVIENKSIPGRAGTLSVRTGEYTDTTIKNNMEFTCAAVEEFEKKLEEVKKFLQKSKKISYTDGEDRYYIVKKVEVESVKRKYGIYGNIVAVFTCEPFAYFKTGDFDIDVSNGKMLINVDNWTQPVYKIVGNGLCTVSVNGKSVQISVENNITLDTKLMIAYRDDGTSQNTAVRGDYEDLYLQHDENVISVTPGFECRVIPRWRCL